MSWALEPLKLEGHRVQIRNYTQDDFLAITEALLEPDGWFGRHWGYSTPERIQQMLKSLLESQGKGVHNALAYWVNGRVAGITRLMRIEPSQRSLEIGGTWVAREFQKTFVNTEVKSLLLAHCFETLKAERVEFRVDARNINSQRAVLRIGGQLEGRLRTRQLYPDGVARDGFLFSIIKPDWETVQNHLAQRLKDPTFSPDRRGHCPTHFETDQLRVRKFEPGDAESFFALLDRCRQELGDEFPTTFRESTTVAKTEIAIWDRLHQWELKTLFSFAVIHKPSGQLIGQLQFRQINWEIPAVELSYFFIPEHRHKGLGTELVQKAVEVCFKSLQMQRITLRILPHNHASQRVAEKLGFQLEGRHRNEFALRSGELKDVCYFSLLKSEHLHSHSGSETA